MKKTVLFLTSILFAVIMILALPDVLTVPANATVSSGTCGVNLTWSLDTDTGVLTISGSGAMENYVDYYFSPFNLLSSYIIEVEIENGVTSIGDYAFYNCTSLESITIPNSVTRIGDYAFGYCTSLESITIPNSVTRIGNWVFYYCTSLESITIPNSVTRIGYWVFYHCESLRTICFAGNETEWNAITKGKGWDSNAGSNVGGYTVVFTKYNGSCGENVTWELDIQSGVLTISGSGEMTDYRSDDSPWRLYKEYIETVRIGNGVTYIGRYAFFECTNLENVEISDSVIGIGGNAFCDCSKLTNIEIPNSVTYIDGSAFRDCTSLTSVKIPNSVININNLAFSGCSSLTSVDIGDSVAYIGYKAFEGCSSLKTICYVGNETEWNAITKGTDWDLNAGGNVDGGYTVVFTKYNGSCGENVTWELDTLSGVLTINGSGDMDDYPSATSVPWYSYRSYIKTVSIGEGVTNIGNYAFFDCSNLAGIEIPDSVMSIGKGAFGYCSSLVSIEIPNSVTSIGNSAFWGCSSLAEIEIPNSVTSIGDGAFRECPSLVSIKIPNSVTNIGEAAFRSCTSLESVVIGDGITSISYKAFEYCTSLISIEIPDSVTSIGNYAFAYCESLKRIEIPNSVTSIGSSAFYVCSSLESVKFPNSITSIDGYLLSFCYDLKTIYFVGYESEWNSLEKGAYWDWNAGSNVDGGYKVIFICPGNYTSVVVPPTCTEDGYTVNTCVDCGDVYRDAYTSPAGHDLDENYRCNACGVQFDAPLKAYSVYIYDMETNKPVEGVSVTLGNETKITVADGRVTFQIKENLESAYLHISADEYPEQTFDSYAISRLASDTIYLTSNTSNITGVWCNSVDVLNSSTQLSVTAHNLKAKFKVTGQAQANITRFEIIQDGVIIGSKKVTPSKTAAAEFEIANIYFKSGKPVSVRMYTDGAEGYNVFKIDTNIKVAGYKFNIQSDFLDMLPISGKLSFVCPDGVPLIENCKFDISVPGIDAAKVKFEMYNDKVIVMFGAETDFAEDKSPMEQFKKAKDDFKKFQKATANKFKIESSAYIGMVYEFDETGITKTYGVGCISVGGKYTFARTFPTIVPIYFEIGVGLNGELEITNMSAVYNPDVFDAMLTFTVEANAYLGVGCRIISAGVYGNAMGKIGLEVYPEQRFDNAMIHGELGLYAKVKILFFKELCYKYTLLSGTKYWPENTVSLSTVDLYSTNSYRNDSREYLQYRSEWLGGGVSTFSLDATSSQLLQEFTYTAIDPKLVQCGDTIMMLFLDDDGSSGLNYQHLNYSVYDNVSGSWSVPKRVDSNDNCDTEFDVYADGNVIYIAYTELAPINEAEQDDYSKILSSTEVITAQYDPVTDSFINHTNLSNNDSFDSQPEIGKTANGVAISWVNNITNDLFSQNANNIIMISENSGTGWSDSIALTQSGATVTSMDIGILNGNSYVAAVLDLDCDLSTTTDRVVNIIDFGGNIVQKQMDVNSNDGVQFVEMNGTNQLLWYGNANIYSITSPFDVPTSILSEPIDDLSGRFKFLKINDNQYAIMFIKNEQIDFGEDGQYNGSNVYGLFYNDGVWGNPVAVTENDIGRYVDSYDVCMYGDKLLIPYISADVSITDDIVKNTNFMCSCLELKNDLVLNDVYVEGTNESDVISINLYINNNSVRRVSGISYYVMDAYRNIVASGVTYPEETQYIESGSSGYITVEIAESLLSVGTDYYAQIDTAEWFDSDLTNNSIDLNLWNPDFSLDANQTLQAENRYIDYSVANNGNIAGDATVKVYKIDGNNDEILLDSHVITDLIVGETKYGRFEVTSSFYDNGLETGIVYVEVVSSSNDSYMFDNVIHLSVGGIKRDITSEVEDHENLIENPVINNPFVEYDKVNYSDVTVLIDEKGASFTSISDIPVGSYDYSFGTLTINKDYLRTLGEGNHYYTLYYTNGSKIVEVIFTLEIKDTSYTVVTIAAADHTVKYDGLPVSLENEIIYETDSLGTVTTEYSYDGFRWTTGLPTEIGEYLVRLNVAQDDENRYLAASCTFALKIEKGTRAISSPAVYEMSEGQIKFGGSKPTALPDDGRVLYGYSLINDASTVSQWSDTGLISEVDINTTYYLFSKVVDGQKYGDAYSLGYKVDMSDYMFKISGTVTSYGDADDITLTLVDSDGNIVDTIMTTEGNYSFSAPSGEYTIIVDKKEHITCEVEVVVTSDDVIKNITLTLKYDTNGDGKVNSRDLLALAKHLAGWSDPVTEAALDADGNGKVNSKDLLHIAKYLAGWNMESTQP